MGSISCCDQAPTKQILTSAPSSTLIAGTISCIDPAILDGRVLELPAMVHDDAIDTTSVPAPETVGPSSVPPSPPSSGDSTPTLRIMPCPARLSPTYPPFNYGTVEHQRIFRSAYPLERNMDFVMSLKIKTVLCLVTTEPCVQYAGWVSAQGVKRLLVDIAPNKDGQIKTTTESLYEAVLYAMTKANHPIYVHCNQGKHRTGCVMACMRKVQGSMTLGEIVDEYKVYAAKKARDGDIELIRAFDPKAFLNFAAACSHDLEPYTGFLVRRRVDSGTVIQNLRDLPCTEVDFDMLAATATRVSCSSLNDGDDLEMKDFRPTPPPLAMSPELVNRVEHVMGHDVGHQRVAERVDLIMGNSPSDVYQPEPTLSSRHQEALHPVSDEDVHMTVTEVSKTDLTPPAVEYSSFM